MEYQSPPHGFRTFMILWITQSVSVVGSALTLFATTIWLAQGLYPRADQQPALAFALAAVGLAYGMPMVFLAPIAGAWADRHDRKRTMIIADTLSGIISLLMVVLLVMHMLSLPSLLLLLALYSAASTWHYSAFDTSYAMLVREDQLPRANGMMQTTQSLSGMLAPALAASIISLPILARRGIISGSLGSSLAHLSNGTILAIAVDMVSFFTAAAVLVCLEIPSPRMVALDDAHPQTTLWADVYEGVTYIWHRRPLLWLLGTFAMANLIFSFLPVLEPLIVKFTLSADWSSRGLTFETALALLTSAVGVGGVIGGIVISTWGGLRTRRVLGVVVPMLISGLALIGFGLSPLIYLTAAMAFLEGAMTPLLNAHSQAIWQTQTPRELQGRVFAVRRLIAQGSLPLGTVLGGVVGGLFSPGYVVVAMGSVLALFCAAQLLNPYLMRVEDKAWLEALATRALSPERS